MNINYSRHRLTWLGKPFLGLLSGWAYYPGEFYIVLFNKVSREILSLLSGWAYYRGLINRCLLYLRGFMYQVSEFYGKRFSKKTDKGC